MKPGDGLIQVLTRFPPDSSLPHLNGHYWCRRARCALLEPCSLVVWGITKRDNYEQKYLLNTCLTCDSDEVQSLPTHGLICVESGM